MASILLIEDEASIRLLYDKLLTQNGHVVVTASDGLEALKKIKQREFDLIITDLIMPVMEGLETIREVKKLYPNQKIITVTGRTDSQYLDAARLFGAKRVLTKPVSLRHLLDEVDVVLSADEVIEK